MCVCDNLFSQRIPNLIVNHLRKYIDLAQIRICTGIRELKHRVENNGKSTKNLLMLVFLEGFLEEVMMFKHGGSSLSLYNRGRMRRNSRQK